MDLEIVGRHALFFDEDSMANFVNSPTALVDWNSLFIDRYDVRHLLSSLPPPRSKRRRTVSDDPGLESDLNRERYFDLPTDSPSPSYDEDDIDDVSASTNADGFRAVPFSYGSSGDFGDQKVADMESGFNPPFHVPDYLLQQLMLGEDMEFSKPPTEKLHQIIARTSSFVSKHGGQSEIVLRVKQGCNPTFGFLMPDHYLHPYFRFLVEHQDLLTEKSSVEDKNNESEKDGGALSLLGSVYGNVEDEDTKEESSQDCKTKEYVEGGDAVKLADSNEPEGAKRAAKVFTRRDIESKHYLPPNDQTSFVKGNPSVSAVNVLERKQNNTEDNATDKLLTSEKLQCSAMLAQPKLDMPIVEPPIEMKRAIDKIVEFIQKNGKELEATLAAQDVKYGMFPFLHPASLYHTYYRKVLQEAEEVKSCDKDDIAKKKDMKREKMDNTVKDDKPAFRSVFPADSAKKENLKTVTDKPKIEELHKGTFKPVERQTRVNVDANTAAAILQAARRGIRNPQLGILSAKLLDDTSQNLGNDGRNTSSKSTDLAKSTGQLISGSAASEADCSEASLTKEQKLKAERLKRAKMFVALLKPGTQPAQQAEPSRSSSVEPLDSGISGLSAIAAKEREGCSIPSETEMKQANDGDIERRSKRNYRSRLQRDENNEMEDEGDDKESSIEEVTEETKTEKKHSSRKRRDRHTTRHSSKDRHSLDRSKHESSSEDDYHSRSRCGHKHRKSSDRHELYDSSDNKREHRRSRSSKHNKDVDYSKDKHSHHHRSRRHDRHIDSSDDEHHRHHGYRSSRRKHEDTSDIEHSHGHKSSKRMKKDKNTEVDETVSKPEDNIPCPQNEPAQVSDELRAKIRAMLADTL